MVNIFISYRRIDSEAITRRVKKRLVDHFKTDTGIFLDVDAIRIGSDFWKVAIDAINHSDVFIAIIGPQWLSITDELGHRRVDNDDDLVCIEIETALQRGMPIIPLLVDGAVMPRDASLHLSLRDFAHQNAKTVRSGSDFEDDMREVIQTLEGYPLTAANLPTALIPIVVQPGGREYLENTTGKGSQTGRVNRLQRNLHEGL